MRITLARVRSCRDATSLGARTASVLLGVVGCLVTSVTQAVAIQGPSTSATGAFQLSWPAGYELWHQDVAWAVAGGASTSASFTDLPAGHYRFVLAACVRQPVSRTSDRASCERVPGTEKAVVVTGAATPLVDHQATSAGTTEYAVAVNPRGGAEITIPLRTPRAPGGIALDLQLGYDSSRAGDGMRHVVDDVLGYGWHLRGLSSIHRCRVGQSGDTFPGRLPQMRPDDGFCLDGEALLLIAGAHGIAGAEYRVGADPDRKVVLRSTPAHGLWFEVAYPDGAVARFGDTSNSRVRASGRIERGGGIAPNEPFVWGLRALTGALGGRLEVSYQRYDGYGVLQPARLVYGEAEVDFSYGARVDLAPRMLGPGSGVRGLSVLNRISMRVSDKPIREYRLVSEPDPQGRVILREIQECGFDPDGFAQQCLLPLVLQWRSVAGDAVNYPVVLAELRDGLGAQVGFDYALVAAAASPVRFNETPFGPLVAVPEAVPRDALVVAEHWQSDGRAPGGMRRWHYAYQGAPLQSARARGFLGFAAVRTLDLQTGVARYSQIRLDWPFVGMLSQMRTFDAPFGSHTRELAREEHGYAQKVLADGSRHAHLAASTRWLLEQGQTVGAILEQRSFCYRVLKGDHCPGSGREHVSATQYRRTTTSGTGLSNPAFKPAFWGDIPRRSIAGPQRRRTITELAALASSSTPWVRNAVVRRAVDHAVPGVPGRTVVETFSHLAGTRIVQRAVRFPGVPRLEHITTRNFDRGALGLLSEQTVQGANVTPRTWRFASVDPLGRHRVETTNPLGQITARTVDPRFAAPRETVDADGRLTMIEYDAFGRVEREMHPDGTAVSTRVERCDQVDCSAVLGADPALRVTVSSQHGTLQSAPTQVSYLDVLGRVVLREVEGLSGAQGWRAQRFGYDAANRLRYVTRPVIGAAVPVCTAPGRDCTWLTWDIHDRLVREDRPDGGSTQTSFAAAAGRVIMTRTETIVTPGNANVTRTNRASFDVLGQLVETVDAVGSAVGTTSAFAYDAQGHLAAVTVAGARIATLEHDLAGNRIKLTEASSGVTTFSYDALGQLVGSTDAKGQTSSFEYDLLGRLVIRRDADGSVHRWTWDPEQATGRLAARSRPGFAESYAYHADHGRLQSIESQIQVSGVWTGNARREFTYDEAGRIESQRYPNGEVVGYDYSPTGYLSRVRAADRVLHEIRATDGFGSAIDEHFQEGALHGQRSFDPTNGLLTRIRTGTAGAATSIQDLEIAWRSDRAPYRRVDRRGTLSSGDDYLDTFSYDSAGRLTRQLTSGAAARSLAFDYARNGNLVALRGSQAGDARAEQFVFDPKAPYRPTSVTLDGVPTILTHDANGNLTRYTATTGPSMWLSHDARNHVVRIGVGADAGNLQAQDEFWHDPDGQRFLSREAWREGAGWASRTVFALGGDYEETRAPGGAAHDIIQRIQVSPVARLVRRRDARTGVWSMVSEYLHRDHLGSVAVITDAAGVVLARQSFDPYGGRRAPDHASSLDAAGLQDLQALEDVVGARGFTGHEHRNRTGLIHMNGRIYDPRMGRFVSPDPMVQAPWIGANQNRYAYALGRPLSLVDPTGRCNSEVRAPMAQCRPFDEHIIVVGVRTIGTNDFFRALDRVNPAARTSDVIGAVARGAGSSPAFDRLPSRPSVMAGDSAPGAVPTDPIEQVVVVAEALPAPLPVQQTDDWVARGLLNLHRAGIGSLFGSGCLGAVLGGCGALAVQTADGSIYGMLMFGVIPGAGVSAGTEGPIFAGSYQSTWGFGTAVFVSGGVSGIGGSLGMAQGSNGFNITGAAGYGFGLGGGVGFYVSGVLSAPGP